MKGKNVNNKLRKMQKEVLVGNSDTGKNPAMAQDSFPSSLYIEKQKVKEFLDWVENCPAIKRGYYFQKYFKSKYEQKKKELIKE